jgi:hypothetical protein
VVLLALDPDQARAKLFKQEITASGAGRGFQTEMDLSLPPWFAFENDVARSDRCGPTYVLRARVGGRVTRKGLAGTPSTRR